MRILKRYRPRPLERGFDVSVRKIICLLAFILSGCVYEQSPAPINAVDIIDETPKQPPAPTSISYPLPDAPRDINNVIINQPQPVPNPDIMATDANPHNTINSIDPTPITPEQVAPQQNNDQLIDSIISSDAPAQSTQPSQVQQAPKQPMGSYNNPVKFDQSKVY